MTVLGFGALVIRAFEFRALDFRWDTNAYGSVFWAVLFLHTVHLVTDISETAVMAGMAFLGPMDARRFVDVSENAEYWDFVVLTWLPLYAILYWAPRLLAP